MTNTHLYLPSPTLLQNNQRISFWCDTKNIVSQLKPEYRLESVSFFGLYLAINSKYNWFS